MEILSWDKATLSGTMNILLAFDFDNIIIIDNSDTWIVQCAPEETNFLIYKILIKREFEQNL